MAESLEEVQVSPEVEMLRNNTQDGFNYRERRHADWTENYTLYRDKVIVNRLTQRQSVNIPLMKTQIRSLLKDVDDMPVLHFENLDNDDEAEVFQNEYWKWTSKENHLGVQDIVDKRQVLLFGRSFMSIKVVDGRIVFGVEDPQHILVSRYVDTTNLHSSRFLIHQHIFRPLSALRKNTDYDQEALDELETWYMGEDGLIKSEDNVNALVDQNEKMAVMGVEDVEDPILGETYVELTLHFLYRNDEKDEQGNEMDEQIFLYVVAEDMKLLMKKPLEEVIGKTKSNYWRTHYPYSTWGDDVEKQDFWSDGVGDIIRTPNKIVNSWFSQLTENRTLRNFGMHYYNSNLEGFQPQSFQPIPWGWYPIPVQQNGSIKDVMQKVEVPDLSESIDEMNFLITMAEKASGATSTQQGATSGRQVTLGEIELTLGEAKERTAGMGKFYTPAWEEKGEMFLMMIEAASDRLDAVEIYKEGRNSTKLYKREIEPGNWMTESGYRTRVWSQAEKFAQDTEDLQLLNAARASMPDNPKLTEIYQRRLLEIVKLSPEEINAIMEFEERKRESMIQAMSQGMSPVMGQQPGQMGAGPGAQQTMPMQQGLPQTTQ